VFFVKSQLGARNNFTAKRSAALGRCNMRMKTSEQSSGSFGPFGGSALSFLLHLVLWLRYGRTADLPLI
jgi:hypothetical protein